jgi:hypothetical protein
VPYALAVVSGHSNLGQLDWRTARWILAGQFARCMLADLLEAQQLILYSQGGAHGKILAGE